MEKTIKIISTLMIVIMIMMAATPVFASSVITDLDDYDDNVDMSKFSDIAGKILGFLRNASYIIGVIVLVILGIKYMMGSLEEKAEYKKSLTPLVVGIIIVMGATTIATFLFDTFRITPV